MLLMLTQFIYLFIINLISGPLKLKLYLKKTSEYNNIRMYVCMYEYKAFKLKICFFQEKYNFYQLQNYHNSSTKHRSEITGEQ